MSHPSPKELLTLKHLIERMYDKLDNQSLQTWGILAKEQWAKNQPSLVNRLQQAGGLILLNQAATIAQEQAVDLFSSLIDANMDPHEAEEQAIRQAILGFDPAALEPRLQNPPTQETFP